MNGVEQSYIKIAKIMQAFSDPKRLLILDMLSCGERCATELQEALSMTQPTTSYHMKLLTDTGAVAMRSEGKYVFYSLNHQKLLDFMQSFAWLTAPKPDCVCQALSPKPCRGTQKEG